MRHVLFGLSLLLTLNSAWRSVSGDDKGSGKSKRLPLKKIAATKIDSGTLEVVTNSLGMKLVKIPAGTFNMGSDQGFDDQTPVHRVTISKPFFLGVAEVTQSEYEAIMGDNPSQNLASADHPVDSVSWPKAVEFCEKLSEREGLHYRLPTEAEWEYSCRAGGEGKIGLGEGGTEVAEEAIGDYAWLRLNSDGTQPVARKRPNAWGLYDMHGNVFEWCQDNWLPYSEKPRTDPIAIAKKVQKVGAETYVLRGGSCEWGLDDSTAAARCRCNKNLRSRTVGFRVARSI